MRKLKTIQTANKLNDVFAVGEPGPGGAHHLYNVYKHGTAHFDNDGNLSAAPEALLPELLLTVQFQSGPHDRFSGWPVRLSGKRGSAGICHGGIGSVEPQTA